jgi:hypothetical protein
MTKSTKRMSKADQAIVASLVTKYGVKEVKRIVEKTPGRLPGRPASKLSRNNFSIWRAVKIHMSEGMNKTKALKLIAKTLTAQTSRKVAWETLNGYYLAAERERKADPITNKRLSQELAGQKDGLKFVRETFGDTGVVMPVLFNRQK